MAEVMLAAETRAALAADLTMRCLLKTKYDRDSRHSQVAIPWAQSRAEKLTRAMLKHVGQQSAGFSIQLNIVELLGIHKALICYDVFSKNAINTFGAKSAQALSGQSTQLSGEETSSMCKEATRGWRKR